MRPLIAILVLSMVAPVLAAADTLPARFSGRAEELFTEFGLPGMQAAYIVGEDSKFVTAVGLADSASNAPMTIDTRLPAGSTGKTFLAAVIIDLALKGVVDMDEPVAKWFEGEEGFEDEPWFDEVPNHEAMTLRLLMNHASGVPDHLADPGWKAELDAILAAGDERRDEYIKPRDSLSHVCGDTAMFAPGAGSLYTDTAYLIAGLAAEKATSRGFYEMAVEDFIQPLALDGILPANTRHLPNLGCGYMGKDNPFGLPTATLMPDGTMNHNPGLEYTGGGFVTTTEDLARWMWLLYSGRLFPDPYLKDLLLKGHPLNMERFGVGVYGLAVFVQDSDWGEVRWHSGWYPGYHTMVRYWPEHDTLIAVQVNRDYDTNIDVIAAELATMVLPELEPKD
jgi:D-alanyl-D-alanine carboxypeptidase